MQAEPPYMRTAPPHQLEAEQSLLGGMLLDGSAIPEVLEILEAGELYRDRHRTIFAAILDLFQRREPVDVVTVADLLRDKNKLEEVGGVGYLADLLDLVPSATNVGAYARIIADKALLRRLIQVADSVSALCYGAGGKRVDEILDEAGAAWFAATEKRIKNGYSSLGDLLAKAISHVEQVMESNSGLSGIPSFFTDLDRLTCGFQRGDLIILAARPSLGKTALCLNIAHNAAMRAGIGVGIFSLEMSKEQLALRLLCSEGRVDGQKLRSGFLSQAEAAKLIAAAGRFVGVPIYIDDTPAISCIELRAKARRMMSERGLGMIVVDYLQLMKAGRESDSREQEISEISASLKALAKELNIPVIALSQLNRKVEERADKRPNLADLRHSGAIEQDADVVAFIYRDEIYNPNSPAKGVAEIIVAKQRNGPTGVVKLAYLGVYTRFENLA